MMKLSKLEVRAYCWVLKQKNNNLDFSAALRKNKLLSVPADDNVIRLTPPLIISNEEVDKAINIIDQSLRELND